MADASIKPQCLTYKFRLLPNRAQHAALAAILESQRLLYNAALEERIGAYRATGKGRSFFDQCVALTECRRDLPEMAALPLAIQRGTIKRVDLAFAAFFRRVKAGKGKTGFPRFRGKGWFNSFEFQEFVGIRFDGRRLRFKGMPGGMRIHMHRALPAGAKLLGAKFIRDAKGWSICLPLRAEIPEDNRAVQGPGRVNSAGYGEDSARNIHHLPGDPGSDPCVCGGACTWPCCSSRSPRGSDPSVCGETVSNVIPIGIDVGLSSLATLSDGTMIPNARPARSAEKAMRRAQRALARCKRGSKRRRKVRARLARLHAKIANTRRTHLHQTSAALVKRYSAIAVEKLTVKNMVRSAAGTVEEPGKNVAQKAGLNRSISDAGWSTLRGFLRYKAERAGIAFAEVDPKKTSQTCPACGEVRPKALSERVHRCDCGCVLHRDVAAARVILQRAVVGPWAHNVAGHGERAPGNLS